MKTIYLPLPLGGYELCHPVNPADFETISVTINGERRARSWRSPKMRLVHQDEGRPLAPSDSPWLGDHALIFRSHVIARIGPLLKRHGELLALDCDETELCIYNAMRVVNALDESASSVVRFKSGRIMMVERYEFRSELLRDVDIFKIPNLRVSPTFVSRAFVDAWEASGFVGLQFDQVWAPN